MPYSDAQQAMMGRWDLMVQTPGGEQPAWLEIRHSGHQTLVGQFVGWHGSARPIARVDVDNSHLRFAIPPQWERGTGDLTVEGQLQDDQLSGSMVTPDGSRVTWTGSRAPSLRRAAAPTWGEPIRLFNGVDLTGWHVVQGNNEWEVADGVLCNLKTGGNLVTDQTFTDFQLQLEFRYAKRGNSGVYLRGRYEVQVLDGPTEEPDSHLQGAIYGFLTPSEIVTNGPDEWNTFEITLVGRLVTVVVNGKTVISEQAIPGITGGALDSDEGAPGPILLQGDHSPIQYRNIVLTPAV
jgi:3-keto-disaccharide hydrolase